MRFSNQNIRAAHWRWMLPILLLAVFLGAQGLNADAIWIDELTSIGHAGGLTGPFSPVDVLASVRDISPKHTPLFFELTAGWAALVGWHHAALRILPLFFRGYRAWPGFIESAGISPTGASGCGRACFWD